VVIAGEMLELGPDAPALHRECGRKMAAHGVEFVVGVRGNGESIAEGAASAGVAAEFVESPELAGEWLAQNLREGDAVLLKASRGVGLERALAVFEAKKQA
jgi:UDP-N-acetylmuramoyl-tripeptide--D-alanyl-D-alanine ligase